MFQFDITLNKYILRIQARDNSQAGTYQFTYKAQITISPSNIVTQQVQFSFQFLADLNITSLVGKLPINSLPTALTAFKSKQSELNFEVPQGADDETKVFDSKPPKNLLIHLHDGPLTYLINGLCKYQLSSATTQAFIKKNADNSFSIDPTTDNDLGSYSLSLLFEENQDGCLLIDSSYDMSITVLPVFVTN